MHVTFSLFYMHKWLMRYSITQGYSYMACYVINDFNCLLQHIFIERAFNHSFVIDAGNNI